MTPTPTPLTPDAVLALAPDAASAQAARKLAAPGKWQNLNTPDGSLWGECQGSGRTPYLTGVDLSGPAQTSPAFKCTCPSRKFPCKHALALLLLRATHADTFGQAAPPATLQTWLDGRAARAAPTTPTTTENAAPDPAAQARRRAAREKKVTAGLDALQTFLKDLIRDGLAHAPARPYSDWDTQAARLVDAQAPGAARLVRQIPDHLHDPAALLSHLTRLYLLTEAWPRRDTLSGGQQADLRAALGFPLDSASVLAGGGIRADWQVMGQSVTEEDTLSTRRTWLVSGEHTALLLDFSAWGRPFPPALPPGAAVQAEVCHAPGTFPQRALLNGEALAAASGPLPAGLTLDALLDRHGAALALNPWLDRTAHLTGPLQVIPGDPWHAQDTTGRLPLSGSDRTLHTLLALSGGHPVTVYAEWNGETLTPLSVQHEGTLHPFRTVADA
ncbi:SWIM zinc finger family protein [Deinococcus sp. RIT780]|uniref:SWIM zinc finger family protein n=1 Tax=Deinococcus sp. RIT780 TaxID=2870472 RepID=UPI001C8A8E51|nr:SWIM zinc finger family protein [Deinococcus sp. RIT780]MBX8466139.1 SWIM zinc finger family protein [Deinococcus sp. RIT780]